MSNTEQMERSTLLGVVGGFLGIPFLAVWLLTACGSPVTVNCTDIGCSSGLEVQLEQAPASPYRVEANAGGSDAKYVFECNAAVGCSRIFFPEFTPDWLMVSVIAGADTTWYEVRPSYQKRQPNGPDCEPTCLNAVVQLPSDAITSR